MDVSLAEELLHVPDRHPRSAWSAQLVDDDDLAVLVEADVPGSWVHAGCFQGLEQILGCLDDSFHLALLHDARR
ncbi:hypothetical protein ABT117_32960 [Streptomyces sp. NPDC002262]|uniref:hypothetical protein n=1 Tax=Streptomyces sp. NPDC002262 TaxID=3154414 RepID=UPI0033195587